MNLHVLGCAGGIGGRERLTTCMLIDHDILLDAGTGLATLSIDQLINIDHVFLTHGHLDHVVGLTLLVDAIQGKKSGTVYVHATEQIISMLKKHLFNWALWPDFTEIPDADHGVFQWVPMEVGSSLEINGRIITSHAVNHTAGSVAYRLDGGKDAFVFTGDMCSTPELWLALMREENIKKVIVDCSFTNDDDALAARSKHFCPRSLIDDIRDMPESVEFLIYHLKPGQEERIMNELRLARGKHVITMLQCGDQFHF